MDRPCDHGKGQRSIGLCVIHVFGLQWFLCGSKRLHTHSGAEFKENQTCAGSARDGAKAAARSLESPPSIRSATILAVMG
ncbi:MAG TPA: hypothetical protein DHV57_03075, partial [Hyphomonas sp.]|nr:hypothetical protein [Hyphomonas sp.]HBX97751.1 hypothetical protein [Hyphomonas sp.]HCJ16382.1 hypothetical protein [Hyphomonas sp.]